MPRDIAENNPSLFAGSASHGKEKSIWCRDEAVPTHRKKKRTRLTSQDGSA